MHLQHSNARSLATTPYHLFRSTLNNRTKSCTDLSGLSVRVSRCYSARVGTFATRPTRPATSNTQARSFHAAKLASSQLHPFRPRPPQPVRPTGSSNTTATSTLTRRPAKRRPRHLSNQMLPPTRRHQSTSRQERSSQATQSKLHLSPKRPRSKAGQELRANSQNNTHQKRASVYTTITYQPNVTRLTTAK